MSDAHLQSDWSKTTSKIKSTNHVSDQKISCEFSAHGADYVSSDWFIAFSEFMIS